MNVKLPFLLDKIAYYRSLELDHLLGDICPKSKKDLTQNACVGLCFYLILSRSVDLSDARRIESEKAFGYKKIEYNKIRYMENT